jgi:hypothetical protein
VAENRAAIEEESRVLTTAVVETLARGTGGTNGTDHANTVIKLGYELARQDQQLEGLLVLTLDVEALLSQRRKGQTRVFSLTPLRLLASRGTCPANCG